MTLILIVVAVLLLMITLTSLTIAVDRSSRATAWRQIAVERRWNHEQHLMTTAIGAREARPQARG